MTSVMFALEMVCEGLLRHAGDEISPYLEDRVTELQALYTAYNSLAPKPEDWPNRAQYYAIDADGAGYWYEIEPTFAPLDGAWGAPQWKYNQQHDIDDLLAALSPRLFLWKRPEKQP